ncbi:MAG: HD domain-containing protein [Desulfobulbaceae bacterium]|nr:HD domain-containing protein [Desulfobulbaceae bacterium]
MNNEIDFRQVVHALSDSLDLVGVDEVQHGKRVAFMAMECGRALGMDSEQLDRLYHAALLHDCGVSSTTVHRYLVTELDWAGAEEHCLRGHKLLDGHELFAELAPLIRLHHTHWDELRGLGLDEETALINNCIYLVDRVDALVARQSLDELLLTKEEIRDTIAKYRDTFFAPQLVDVFLKVSANEFFWLTLQPRHLGLYLAEMAMDSKVRTVGQDSFLRIARMFATIVDAKSPFTVEHSLGVSRLAKHLGTLLGLPADTCNALEVAGLLHDLGKLRVPDEILEKPGPLTDRERATMKHHSFESYQILRRIDGFDSIAEMAAFHHETLSGEGYPFHRQGSALSTEARMIAVADIFQALAQNRPYRSSLPPAEIVSILEGLVAANKLDRQVVRAVAENLGTCWEAATSTPYPEEGEPGCPPPPPTTASRRTNRPPSPATPAAEPPRPPN